MRKSSHGDKKVIGRDYVAQVQIMEEGYSIQDVVLWSTARGWKNCSDRCKAPIISRNRTLLTKSKYKFTRSGKSVTMRGVHPTSGN